ncbi:MAG: diguanylate cyclase [Micromonosporaceae bacterium]|nr:diguanylate cyclase [Micromonosporaceae bacterium]
MTTPLPERVYTSPRTAVTRMTRSGGRGTFIVKEPLGPDAYERRCHELSMLQRLAGVAGVVQLESVDAGPEAIALVDLAGTTLRAADGLDTRTVLDLAATLASVVAAVHRRGVVHRDICPDNVVLTADDQPTLIDFELATTFTEQRSGFLHESQIAGTLAYIAPEQTGRTGRAVDHRADLYSLGATLYELATGHPPFDDRDALRLIHHHLVTVPAPPIALNPALPPPLSDMILRLLEKEPDQRYQSAEGLAFDLSLVRERLATSDPVEVRLGERDFPLRLAPPSRLVGRERETGWLADALAEACAGRGRVALVSGAPGVGKTALIDGLRPLAAARGGWFVSGKFDQIRADLTSDAVLEAMRALGRLLLAEPDARLADLRSRLQATLGPNASLVASIIPEFAMLLREPPRQITNGGGEWDARLVQAGLEILRVVASPSRPLVIAIDDLQWASSTPLGFVDAVLREEDLSEVLVVGMYRDTEIDAAHPLSAVLARWDRLGCAPRQLRLANLTVTDLRTMLAEMLRLDADQAGLLAQAVAARTGGNPYDTIELLNALRRDSILVCGAAGWSWDPRTVRGFVSDRDVVGLLSDRIDRLPEPTRTLLETMSCLGGDVDLALLSAATGAPLTTVADQLTAALEDGLLVEESPISRVAGRGTVRFRHDRVQQAAHSRLNPGQMEETQLAMARRLVEIPAYSLVAAQQYLSAVASVREPGERHRLIQLFHRAATLARLINSVAAEQFLSAAMGLFDETLLRTDSALLHLVQAEWHTALCALGRLTEADGVWRDIVRGDSTPCELVQPACAQMASLTGRGRASEALSLGMDLLRRLGQPVPNLDELTEAIHRGLDEFYTWVAGTGPDTDHERAEMSDPTAVAIATMINHLMAPAFFSDRPALAWLVVQARRLWVEHGPHAALLFPLGHASVVSAGWRNEYATGYRALRRVLATGEARGYEPETAQARFLFAVTSAHWFEPLEDDIQQARQAFEGLVQLGELLHACFTYHATTPSMLDICASLDSYAAEVEAGITFATRTGFVQANALCLPFRQLVLALRDASDEPTGLLNAFDDPTYRSAIDGNAIAEVYHHVTRALAAAILGDARALAGSSADAMPMLDPIKSHYSASRAYMLRALALAERVRTSEDRAAPLAELDACRTWLAERAADLPANFRHLLLAVDAERAWAIGDFPGAALLFDEALETVEGLRRPWHQALIAERAGLFHLGHALRHTGRLLLTEAARHYRTWGATAKVRQLERTHPFLADRPESTTQTSGSGATSQVSLDLLAILTASQALSSETRFDRLQSRVVEVLRSMTGASTVQILLRPDDETGWVLAQGTGETVSVADAADRGWLPLSVVRYVERTRAPLLVDDATLDARFANDPYIAPLDRCSLLVAPILSQGTPRAMVLLENRLSRGAFTTERLDAVMLVGGQLAVSLDNAALYTSLERKVAERTKALEAANDQLQELSVTDTLTGLANRRRLAQTLGAEWDRGLQNGQPIAIMMIDIDHFKLYNDRYGHPAGDACLRRVAAVVTQAVRSSDLAARYGGEEFAIVLPSCDLTNASIVAERVRIAVLALQQPQEDDPSPSPSPSTGMIASTITVSIGVASTIPSPDRTPDQLLADADAQLYQAKRAGRNQVAWGTPRAHATDLRS